MQVLGCTSLSNPPRNGEVVSEANRRGALQHTWSALPPQSTALVEAHLLRPFGAPPPFRGRDTEAQGHTQGNVCAIPARHFRSAISMEA
jgi:hypothetical protein